MINEKIINILKESKASDLDIASLKSVIYNKDMLFGYFSCLFINRKISANEYATLVNISLKWQQLNI